MFIIDIFHPDVKAINECNYSLLLIVSQLYILHFYLSKWNLWLVSSVILLEASWAILYMHENFRRVYFLLYGWRRTHGVRMISLLTYMPCTLLITRNIIFADSNPYSIPNKQRQILQCKLSTLWRDFKRETRAGKLLMNDFW